MTAKEILQEMAKFRTVTGRCCKVMLENEPEKAELFVKELSDQVKNHYDSFCFLYGKKLTDEILKCNA